MRGTDLWNYELKRQCGDSRVFMLRYSTRPSSVSLHLESDQFSASSSEADEVQTDLVPSMEENRGRNSAKCQQKVRKVARVFLRGR
jgi:hypothetical protein